MSRFNDWNVVITQEVIDVIKDSFPEIDLSPGNYEMSYGLDHACGYYMQLFDKADDNELALDLDGIFNGLSGSKLGTILKAIYPEPNFIQARHISNAILDLPLERRD